MPNCLPTLAVNMQSAVVLPKALQQTLLTSAVAPHRRGLVQPPGLHAARQQLWGGPAPSNQEPGVLGLEEEAAGQPQAEAQYAGHPGEPGGVPGAAQDPLLHPSAAPAVRPAHPQPTHLPQHRA